MTSIGGSNYHACECYGHSIALPDYQHDVSIPRTSQGNAAKPETVKEAGCVCGTQNGAADTGKKGTRQVADGRHSALSADAVAIPARADHSSSSRRFPNATTTSNQRGSATLTSTTQLNKSKTGQKRAQEKKQESLQDRKNFLKAVLRDEMMARMDAEARRDALEQDTGLMGGNHIVEYEATMSARNNNRNLDSYAGTGKTPSVSEQYSEMMDELRYVAGQPVGSKFNINRLYYLLEEEQRINALRQQEKVAARSGQM